MWGLQGYWQIFRPHLAYAALLLYNLVNSVILGWARMAHRSFEQAKIL